MNENHQRQRDIRNQGYGAIISEINHQRMMELHETLHNIDIQDNLQRQIIEQNYKKALSYIDELKSFVGKPENILGSDSTKHGEIAEHVDVCFQNAEAVIRGYKPTATFEGVGRTAPEDYLVHGIKVQSKYIEGSNKTLSHVLEHLNNYKDIGFGRDGSYYVIPKDQHEEILQILAGRTDNINPARIRAIKAKVASIEEQTNYSFEEVVKPGNVKYAEVQRKAVHKTIKNEKKVINELADEQREIVEQEHTEKVSEAQHKAQPSVKGALKTAAITAAISGGMEFATGIYRKCKAGKKIQDFTSDDWKELGIDTVKAGAEGGISGLALYGLTNVLHLSTHAAGACVSMSFGIAELTYDYCNRKISEEEFEIGCKTVCINSVVCAIGGALGDALIPIPILGHVIGSIIVSNVFDEICGKGAQGAIYVASSYVYGMTHELQQSIRKMNYNMRRTSRNINTAVSMQMEIEAGFDMFEKMKEG